MIPQIREINFPEYATLHEATASFAVMGERTITTQVRIDGDIVPEFDGWELEFKGERFVLPVKEPQAQKNNTTRNSLVDLTFYSWPIYQMKRFFFFETTTTATGTVMADKYQAPVNLNLSNFVALFNRVLDYYFHGKIIADLAEGNYGTAVSAIQLNYSYIWDVLQDFYSIFNVRWTIAYDEENDIYTIKIGYAPDVIEEHEFEYGFQGGLLHFERQLQDDNIKNILLGRGGEKNLPYRYFKKQDPNNPEWAADPDGIKELENIYFDRLRDQNFRNYIQGWKTNPNRLLDTGDVIETYDETRGARDWAYKKGHEDELFDPVEYVKDQDSIEKYGERWGALDDNDDIFPTIQGIIRPGMGRVDEVVAVSPIITDDVQESMEAAAEIVSIEGVMSQVGTVPAYGYIVKQIRGSNFTVPTGQVANIQNNGWFVVNESSLSPYLSVNTDLSKVRIYDASTDQEVLSADQGLPAGTYYYVIDITVQNASASTLNNVTYGVNGLELVISDASAESWKPTFDIWIKNIFESTQQADETDEDYALRVWQEILGDRLGNEAKVVFSDGFMSISEDYEFVIASYPTVDRSKLTADGYRSEWKLTLYKSSAEYEVSGLYIPNNTSGGKPIAGDHFFFVGIDMPHMYVTLAEERLTQYKTLALEQMSEVNPTWVINIDKIRADQVNEDNQRLFDQISPGVEMHVKDKRFTKDEILRLFANTITYTWREPTDDNPYLLPDVEIVVSDRIVVEKSTVEKIQGDLDVLKATYAKMSDMEAVIQQVASPMFLRKTGEQDTSLSPTRFASTVTSRDFRQGGFGGRGWGLYRDNSSKYQQSPNADSSIEPTRRLMRAAATRATAATSEEKATDAVLELDKLIVRKEMQVNSLVVNQIAYIGGKQVNSAAAMECVQVVETEDSYICYFDQKQGSVKNLFQVGDIAMGQVFTPENYELRYYKMIVTATDVDNITISKAGRAGSGAPQKGDVIVQYGNITDESRQYVIIRDVIGGGYERMLSDLNSVDATGTEYFFAGCDMSTDGTLVALFSSDPEPLYDSNGEPLMSTEYARARFFVGGEDSYMEFKQSDRRLYLKGTIVQSPSGDEFPIVCYRGEYDETGQTLYYYGDEVTYRGATYLYINQVPSNAVPTDTTYWQVRQAAGASAKAVDIVASSLFFTYDTPDAQTPTGDQSITLTCSVQNVPAPVFKWYYMSATGWVEISGQTGSTLTIQHNDSRFIDKVLKIKVVVNNDNSLYDEVSIYKVTGGKNGENVLIADIDNEMEGVALTAAGLAVESTVITTVASLYIGTEAQVLTSAAADSSTVPTGCTVSRAFSQDSKEAIFTITIPANTALSASQNIAFNLASADGSGRVVFTLLGVKPGANGEPATTYSILPSSKVVSRDKDNVSTPAYITCQVKKRRGTDAYTDGLADGQLYYYLDEQQSGSRYDAGDVIHVGDGAGRFHDKLIFEFYLGTTLVDRETIFVVDDGEESVSAFLTNTNKGFAGGDTAAIAAEDTTEVIVFRGATQLEYGEDFTIGTITGAPTGMTASVNSTTGIITIAVTTSLIQRQGSLTIPVNISGYGIVNLEYNWTLILSGKGEKGDTGPTIRGPRQWVATEAYVNNEEFIDIVYYDPTGTGSGLYYKRKLVASGVAFSTPPNQDTTHWEESDKFSFVAADVILGIGGKINNLVVDKLKTTNPTSEKAVINIEKDMMSLRDANGDDKVKITSGTFPSSEAQGSSFAMYGQQTTFQTSQGFQESGSESYTLGNINIDAQNNLARIPRVEASLTYNSSTIVGSGDVRFILMIADMIILDERLNVYYPGAGSQSHLTDTFDSGRYIEKTLPIGQNMPITLIVEYSLGASEVGAQMTFAFSPYQTTNNPITYPAQFTMLATDGVQFRYANANAGKDEGFKATEDGAKVIQSGVEYNMAGLGALGNLTAPKRIVFCTSYPSTEEDGVFYIRVSG